MLLRGLANTLLIAISSVLVTITAAHLTQAQSSTTEVYGAVCADGVHAPSLSIDAPSDNATVRSATLGISITTNWVQTITIARDSTVLLNEPVDYGPSHTSSFSVTIPEGQSVLTITAQGGCPTQTLSQTRTVTYTPGDASTKPVVTNQPSPELRGTVDSPTDAVFLRIHGMRYAAINNGDGTWTLPAGIITPDLAEGSYDVIIEIEDASGDIISSLTFARYLLIDLTAPQAGLGTTNSSSRSPKLTGAVDDPSAVITILLNGRSYTATNNGDGTWTLPAGIITPDLASGTYEVIVRTTDPAGNIKESSFKLQINAPNELGFLLAPNTGYMRVGHINIPSWVFYVLAGGMTLGIVLHSHHVHTRPTKP